MIENWNVYQDAAHEIAVYPSAGTKLGLMYTVLGLGGESGAVAEHGKKCLRDDGGIVTVERRVDVIRKLGDVLWYCAAVAHEGKFTLENARLTNPVHFPENPTGYVGHGTAVGFGYLCARLMVEAGKGTEFALHVMPYPVSDGHHWTDAGVGQGRVIQTRLRTALGRTLWYVERIAAEVGTTVEFAMRENLAKLTSRKKRGVLHGDGSNR